MSRNFMGSRMGGGSSGGGTAKKSFMSRMQGGDEAKMTQEEKYQKMVEDKVDAMRSAASSGAKYGVMLPGTGGDKDQGREMSDSTKAIVEELALKRAQKQAKKMKRRVLDVAPKYFTGMQGGRIDSKGNIYGPDGAMVAKVDMKSGKVMKQTGGALCKYSQSSFCEHKITAYINKIYAQKTGGNSLYGTVGVDGNNGGASGIWGSSHNDDPTGGFWG